MEQRSVRELLLGSLAVVLITSFFDKLGSSSSASDVASVSLLVGSTFYTAIAAFSAGESNLCSSEDLP